MAQREGPSGKCPICGDLPEGTTEEFDEFPSYSKKLELAGEIPGGEESFMKCPACGTFYYDRVHMDMIGPGNHDTYHFHRFSPLENRTIRRMLEAKSGDDLAAGLTEAFAHGDTDLIDEARLALDIIERNPQPREALIAALGSLLRHENPAARSAACRSLISIAAKDDIAVVMPLLLEQLSDKRVNSGAAEALTWQYFNKKTWEELRALMRNGDGQVRRGTLWALRDVSYNEDVSGLLPDVIHALSDDVSDVRSHAIDVLEHALMKGTDISSAVPALTEALSDGDYTVRHDSADLLDSAARKGMDISSAVPALTELLSDKGYDIELEAAHALGSAASAGADISSAIDPLARLLSSDPPYSYSTLNCAILHALKEFALKKKENAGLVLDSLKKHQVQAEKASKPLDADVKRLLAVCGDRNR